MPRERRARPRRSIRASLPHLSAAESLLLLDLLEGLTEALWRAYAPAIDDYAVSRGITMPRPPGPQWVGRRGPLPPDGTW